MRTKLKWNKAAQAGLASHVRYVGLDSVYYARQLNARVKTAAMGLLRHPAKHPPDKFKASNDGTFRAFTQYSLRIPCGVFRTSVHIIRVRHVKQRPLYFQAFRTGPSLYFYAHL